MEEQIRNLEAKIDTIYLEVAKMKKYFMITFWATIVFFVLPLIALAFMLPMFLSSFNALMDLGI